MFSSSISLVKAMGTMEKILSGSTVESYRYANSLKSDPSWVVGKIQATKKMMKKKRQPVAYFKELVPSLVNGGYLKQDQMKSSGHKHAVSELAKSALSCLLLVFCIPIS